MIDITFSPGSENAQILDYWKDVLNEYYEEEIYELAQRYPKEQDWLEVDYRDLELISTDFADDFLNHGERFLKIGNYALETFDVDGPNTNFKDDVSVRVSNLPEWAVYNPEDLRAEHGGMYVGIKGSLSKVTQPRDTPETLLFSCDGKCESKKRIEQSGDELTEPGYCEMCERKTNWSVIEEESDWADRSKVKLQQSIDQSKGNEGASINGVVTGSLVEGYGTELYAKAGEDCIAYGILRRKQIDTRGSSDLLYNRYLEIVDIEFDTEEETVDVEKWEEQVRECASREDAVEFFVRNFAPQLKLTDRLSRALWLATAHVYGSPRIRTDSGEIYRGDIHAGIIGDPGVGKSVINRMIELLTPNCVRRSATGISSEVGLTAAAVKDDFGEGEYSLEPGILVRGNGGHAVIDEIDKGPGHLEKINDALEGDQRVTVDKGGKYAEFKTRTALWVTGNPEGGRFDTSNGADPLPAQVDLDPTLTDRFDGLVLIPDEQDEEHDRSVADHILDSYAEASDEQQENETTSREVPVEVMQAWVIMGKEIDPTLTEDAKDIIGEYYATLRDRNSDPETFVTTARAVEGMIRFSAAFARLHLSETIGKREAEYATTLMDKVIGQYYDPDTGTWKDLHSYQNEERTTLGGKTDEMYAVKEIIEDIEGENGADIDDIITEAMERHSLSPNKAETRIQDLMDAGEAYEPQTGEYRAT